MTQIVLRSTDLKEAQSRFGVAMAEVLEFETCGQQDIPCEICLNDGKALVEAMTRVLLSAMGVASGGQSTFKTETVLSFATAKLKKYIRDREVEEEERTHSNVKTITAAEFRGFMRMPAPEDLEEQVEEHVRPTLELIRKPRTKE